MSAALTRRTFMASMALSMLAVAGCSSGTASEPEADAQEMAASTPGDRILVACFSATGHTLGVAEKAAAQLGATLFRIRPEEPYTASDLDYTNEGARCMEELDDPDARPVLANDVEDWDAYGTVLLGYPIWWGQAAPILRTFVESRDWTGRTVVPFCTSGASPIGDSAAALEELAGSAEWLEGQRFAAGAPGDEVRAWVGGLAL